MSNLIKSINPTIIKVVDEKGNVRPICYDGEKSSLWWDDTGEILKLERIGRYYYDRHDNPWEHSIQPNINPNNPGKKSYPFRLIKIQIGLKCNFNCSYCSQEADRNLERLQLQKISDEKDINKLIKVLEGWIEPDDGISFEIWGGEPFLYWNIYRKLCEKLLCTFPKCSISTTTNGSLISEEIFKWILHNERIRLVVSHDGDTEHRDYDTLENEYIHKLFYSLKNTNRPLIFNCVLTVDNLSVVGIRRYIANKLNANVTDINISTEGIAITFNNRNLSDVYFSKLNIFYKELTHGDSLFLFGSYLTEYFSSIASKKPAICIEQKCGMDRSDVIAINLKNQRVITCQNTLPLGKHDLGSVDSIDKSNINTLHHWRSRNNCLECPVLSFCKGCCLYLENDDFEKACDNHFIYNLPFLCAAIYFITGYHAISLYCNKGEFDLVEMTS